MKKDVKLCLQKKGLKCYNCYLNKKNEHRNVQSARKVVRDVPVVAGGARRGVAGLPAVLHEGRGRPRAVHGVERPVAYTRDGLPALGEVGKDVHSLKGAGRGANGAKRTVDGARQKR